MNKSQHNLYLVLWYNSEKLMAMKYSLVFSGHITNYNNLPEHKIQSGRGAGNFSCPEINMWKSSQQKFF